MKRIFLAAALITTYAWTIAVAQQEAPAATLCRPAAASPAAGAVLPQRRLPDGKFESAWTFSWTPCPGADRYHLFVIGPGAQNPIVNVDDLDQTSYTERSTHFGIDQLEGWTWKVRARFDSRWGGWSETRAFNVNSTSDAVPPGVCSISGRVGDDRPAYQTRIELLQKPGNVRVRSTGVNTRGEYRFQNVPEGNYLVVPRGSYPESNGVGLTPSPPAHEVACSPDRSHHKNFRIMSTEG